MLELKSVKIFRKNQSQDFRLGPLSFSLAASECLALSGASASGKTSILKSINRLIEIESGEILFEGVSIKDYPLRELRKQISYMFQRGLLFPHLSVYENLSLPISEDYPKKDLALRVKSLLEACGLEPSLYVDRRPHELSGGELQRVSLALSLVHRPKLLILDEPFNALDMQNKFQLIDYLKRLRAHFRMSILLVSHDISDAHLMADRVLKIEGGKLV